MALENIISKTVSKAKSGLKNVLFSAGLLGALAFGGVREARADFIRPSSYSGDITDPTYAFDNGLGDTDTHSWIGSGNGWKYGYYDFILPPNPDNTLNIIYKNSILEMGEVSIDIYDYNLNSWFDLSPYAYGMGNLDYLSFTLSSDHVEENTNLVRLRGGAWGQYADFGFSSSAVLQLYDLNVYSIPGPTTMSLLGTGLVNLLLRRKKK